VHYVAPLRVPTEPQLVDQIALMPHPRATARAFRDVHEIDVNMRRTELDPVAHHYRPPRQLNSSPKNQTDDPNSDLPDTDVRIFVSVNEADRRRSWAVINNLTALGWFTYSMLRSVRVQYHSVMAILHPDHVSGTSVDPSARR